MVHQGGCIFGQVDNEVPREPTRITISHRTRASVDGIEELSPPAH